MVARGDCISVNLISMIQFPDSQLLHFWDCPCLNFRRFLMAFHVTIFKLYLSDQ